MEPNQLTHGLFCDELELQKSQESALTLYYFGILIKSKFIEGIEKQISDKITKLNPETFHSVKHYKSQSNWDIFEAFNEIIISNNLKIYCFAFIKDWLKLKEFDIINSLSFPEWKEFPKKNYRAISFYLFLHVLNYYLDKELKGKKYIRIIADKDWLKNREVIEHQGIILNHIEKIFSTRQKDIPLIALADHVAYLFNKIKKSTYYKEHKLFLKKEIENDKFSKMSLDAYLKFCHLKLFHFLDLQEWREFENRKYK